MRRAQSGATVPHDGWGTEVFGIRPTIAGAVDLLFDLVDVGKRVLHGGVILSVAL